MIHSFTQKITYLLLILLWTGRVLAQETLLKGVVLDAQSGAPLISATVQVKNGKDFVLTNNKVEFTLSNVSKTPFT